MHPRTRRGLVATAVVASIGGIAAVGFFPLARLGMFSPMDGDASIALSASSARPRNADFGDAAPSKDARELANWVAAADDSRGTPFVIVDKIEARLYAFDSRARLVGATAVLVGSATGDETVPGIGDRPIEQVRPHERTTPAGRFVAERGRNARGEDVVWVDYDAAVSMHRVVTSNATENRLQRLESPTATDNRISYGCINVPVAFYESTIRPIFSQQSAIVYVLPEVASWQQVFGVRM